MPPRINRNRDKNMRRREIILALFLLLGPGMAQAAGPPSLPTTASASGPTPEDLKIIALLETLQLMDLAKSLEVVKDMDVLLEDDHHEHKK